MRIATTTKYGGSAKESRDGFKLNAEADVNDQQMAALAAIGLASLLYRGGASVANKALAVDSNSETEFSDERAATLTGALEKWASDGAGFKADGDEPNPLGSGFDLAITAERHEHGTTGAGEPGVMAKNFWEQVKAQEGFALIGATADTSDEDGVALARKFLGGIKPPRKAKAAKE